MSSKKSSSVKPADKSKPMPNLRSPASHVLAKYALEMKAEVLAKLEKEIERYEKSNKSIPQTTSKKIIKRMPAHRESFAEELQARIKKRNKEKAKTVLIVILVIILICTLCAFFIFLPKSNSSNNASDSISSDATKAVQPKYQESHSDSTEVPIRSPYPDKHMSDIPMPSEDDSYSDLLEDTESEKVESEDAETEYEESADSYDYESVYDDYEKYGPDYDNDEHIENDIENEIYVYITPSGDCYHNIYCGYLKDYIGELTMAEAKRRGYRKCSVCVFDY